MLGEKKAVYGLAAILGLSVVGYMVYQYRQLIDSFKKGFSTVAGAVIQELSLRRIRMTLMFNIQNKSDISFLIKDQIYDIYLNNVVVSRVTNTTPLKIKSNASTMFPLEIDIASGKLLDVGIEKLISTLGGDSSSMVLTIKGKLSLNAGRFINIKDYSFIENIPLKDLIDIDNKSEGKVK